MEVKYVCIVQCSKKQLFLHLVLHHLQTALLQLNAKTQCQPVILLLLLRSGTELAKFVMLVLSQIQHKEL